MRRPLRTFLVAALLAWAGGTAAQPAPEGEALLAAWRLDWRRAAAGVEEIAFEETVSYRIEGPAGDQRVRAESDVATTPYADGPPVRRLRSVEVNGRPVPPRRFDALERRMRRAYGPGFGWTRRPPPLPGRLVARLRPAGPTVSDRVDGVPAWRVPVLPASDDERERVERGSLWFSRGAAPRLLRARLEGGLPDGGTFVLTADYAAESGLDLPQRSRAEVVLRQRRRLRTFAVLLDAETTYARYALSR